MIPVTARELLTETMLQLRSMAKQRNLLTQGLQVVVTVTIVPWAGKRVAKQARGLAALTVAEERVSLAVLVKEGLKGVQANADR